MKAKSILTLFVLFVITSAFEEPPKDVIKLKKTFTSSYTYVPNGLVTLDNEEIEIGAFYMLRTEVSNAQYKEFLNSLKNENLRKEYKMQGGKNEMSIKTSGRETYLEHPVQNISREAAEAYCEWLTKKYDSMDIGVPDDMRIVFRLPTRAEWVRAAIGDKPAPYSWGTKYLRNTKGQYLANFNAIGSEHIHKNHDTGEFEIVTSVLKSDTASRSQNDMVIYTAPVNACEAHGYGLMQMNGNVAEMLSDSDQAAGGSWRSPGYDIRNESLMPFEEASPEVGFRPIGILTEKQE